MTHTIEATQADREARMDHLRAEIRRCDEAIESGTADNWWHIDRDRFRQELASLEVLARHRTEALSSAAGEPVAGDMSLEVALDFADHPRPYHTLQAPADTNGELYEALAVLAAAYRAAPSSQRALDESAWSDVAAERKRQIEHEGWTPEHDDGYANGQMAGAAACYALTCADHWAAGPAIQQFWPWDQAWWKPSDRRRNLVKAAALLLAEIERLDRAALSLTEAQESQG